MKVWNFSGLVKEYLKANKWQEILPEKILNTPFTHLIISFYKHFWDLKKVFAYQLLYLFNALFSRKVCYDEHLFFLKIIFHRIWQMKILHIL